jgi:hypothetical protein
MQLMTGYKLLKNFRRRGGIVSVATHGLKRARFFVGDVCQGIRLLLKRNRFMGCVLVDLSCIFVCVFVFFLSRILILEREKERKLKSPVFIYTKLSSQT